MVHVFKWLFKWNRAKKNNSKTPEGPKLVPVPCSALKHIIKNEIIIAYDNTHVS